MGISKTQNEEMDISAFLNQYVYADEQSVDFDNLSINDIISKSAKLKNDTTLTNALDKNPEWGEIILMSQSSVEGKIPMTELIACTFRDKDGNIYVSYRGTGDGKWVDNGVAMANKSSLMQRRAEEYFNSVVEDEGNSIYDSSKTKNVILIGHSKGGNSAQYVTLASKYAHLIDRCYSMDGQGFSKVAIEKFKEEFEKNYGKGFYENQIDKMYSINGHNDYVHDLGVPVIKQENTYFLNSTIGDGFKQWHMNDGLFNADTGRINFTYKNGDILSVKQGAVGRFAKELSEKVMELDDESLEDCTVSIMSILEFLMGDGDVNVIYGTGDVEFATTEEFVGFINIGIPLIINTIRESENINDVLGLLNLNISKDHWLAEPLFDIIIGISQNMTMEDYEGYVALFNEISNYAKNNGMSFKELINYIKEDPLRLIEIYASLDLGKKSLHQAISTIFSPKNIAKIVGAFALEHPLITSGVVAALSVPVVREMVVTIAGFAVAAGAIYLIANHIIVNWDTIKTEIINGVEYIKDKVAEMYTTLMNKLNEQLNNYVEDVLSFVEKAITIGERFINNAVDQVGNFIGYLRDACKVAIKSLLLISNPILYLIASKIYNASKEPVKINMVRLRQCVNTMNRLASRVANIDSRLDNLYYQLAQNNIEQEEGVFTSLLNMYNLFRADLNVDEGQAIKRKARALTELFENCETTDKWVLNHVPQRA